MKKTLSLLAICLASISAFAVIDSGVTNSVFVPPSLTQTDTNDFVLMQGTFRGKTVDGVISYSSMVLQLQALITGSTNVYDAQGTAQASTNGLGAAILAQAATAAAGSIAAATNAEFASYVSQGNALFGNSIYVSASRGNDANPGTLNLPFATPAAGYLACTGGQTLVIEDGTFNNQTLYYNGANVTVGNGVVITNGALPFMIVSNWVNPTPIINGGGYFGFGGPTLAPISLVGCTNAVVEFDAANLTGQTLSIMYVTNLSLLSNIQYNSGGSGYDLFYLGGGFQGNFSAVISAGKSIIFAKPFPGTLNSLFTWPFTNATLELSTRVLTPSSSIISGSCKMILNPMIVYASTNSSFAGGVLYLRDVELPNGAFDSTTSTNVFGSFITP